MEKENKVCQSCGMPLKRDKAGPALEKDGTPSTKYCSFCYKDGEFTCKECTVKDIQDKNAQALKKMHMPNFLIKKWNSKVPTLERWNNK